MGFVTDYCKKNKQIKDTCHQLQCSLFCVSFFGRLFFRTDIRKWPRLTTYRKEKLEISPVFVVCVMVKEFATTNKYAVGH